MFRRFAVLLLFLLTSCGVPEAAQVAILPTVIPTMTVPVPTFPPTCRDSVAAYLPARTQLWQEWQDTEKLAHATARIALSGTLAQLQDVRRRFMAMEVPACAKASHDALVEAMGYTIDAFVAFMAQESDTKIAALFTQAAEKYNLAADEANVMNDQIQYGH